MGIKVLALACLAGICGPASLAWAAESPGVTEPGVWQAHELDFDYIGFTSHYSCDGLASTLELLLRTLGARADAQVEPYGCDRPFGVPSRFPRATLKFATLKPIEAGAATGATAAPEATVQGSWHEVQLSPQRPYDLRDGDCELIEQFRDKVLPAFATRAVQFKMECIPHQDLGPFSVRLQVFAPAAKSASPASNTQPRSGG